MSIPDLGIDFDRLTGEFKSDLGDILGKVNASARGGLERIANAAQNTSTGLERIAQPTGAGVNGLARIAGYGGSGNTLDNIIGYGGGGSSLDVFDTIGASNPFAAFEQAQYASAMQPPVDEAAIAAAGAAPGGGGGGGAQGAQGSWGAHEKYRQMYTQVASELGLDPDEVAAFAMIETTNADPRAVSPAGAMGLWQVMPFHFKPGEDPFDPLTNTRVALRYYKQQRDKFGPGLAAAAYQGGDGAIVNGRARTDVSDGNMTPAEYAAAWKANYDRIKATAPPMAPGGGDPTNLIGRAETLIGTPYQLGGRRTHVNAPQAGIDCSEFTAWIYEGQGIDLPWNAAQQAKATQPVQQGELQVGDLIFFHSTYDSADGEYITHVGMYAGNGKMIHSGNGGVQYADLSTPYWQQHYAGAGRVKR